MTTKDDLEGGLANIRQEMKDGFRLIDEKLDTITTAIGESVQDTEARLEDHEHRISHLERSAA